MRPSFVKVVELQRRGVPHFHSVIRLDAASPPGEEPSLPDSSLEMADFVELVRRAAVQTKLSTANEIVLRFGDQLDIKSIGQARKSYPDESVVANRRVAAYLAKYVTKSVTDLGIDVRRLSPEGIDLLDVTDHVRRILQTIVVVSREERYEEMALWLHTLGYRGHVTSKSRQFSTTMKAVATIGRIGDDAKQLPHRMELNSARCPGSSNAPDTTTSGTVYWSFQLPPAFASGA
jgi:hypothetical protein